MRSERTRVVKTHDVKIDSNYIQWLNDIKSRYRSAQIKAAVKVNAEQLIFNWQLGRDLVTRKAEEQWGSGVVEQLSMDLQAAFHESMEDETVVRILLIRNRSAKTPTTCGRIKTV